jgi:hypothetical protein
LNAVLAQKLVILAITLANSSLEHLKSGYLGLPSGNYIEIENPRTFETNPRTRGNHYKQFAFVKESLLSVS